MTDKQKHKDVLHLVWLFTQFSVVQMGGPTPVDNALAAESMSEMPISSSTDDTQLADVDPLSRWHRVSGTLSWDVVKNVMPMGHGSVDDALRGKPSWIARSMTGLLGYAALNKECKVACYGRERSIDTFEV